MINRVAGKVCPSADYHDFGAEADAGKSWCFAAGDVAAGPALVDADFTVAGEEGNGFAVAEAEVDATGDGLLDLLVYSAQGIHVIAGTGAPWAGNYQVPSQAAATVPCASSSIWCGFGRAVRSEAIAIAGAGGPADQVSIYALPLGGAPFTPAATYAIDRAQDDSAVALTQTAAFAFGSTTKHRVYIIDTAGTELEVLNGPNNAVNALKNGNGCTLRIVRDGVQRLLSYHVVP